MRGKLINMHDSTVFPDNDEKRGSRNLTAVWLRFKRKLADLFHKLNDNPDIIFLLVDPNVALTLTTRRDWDRGFTPFVNKKTVLHKIYLIIYRTFLKTTLCDGSLLIKDYYYYY